MNSKLLFLPLRELQEYMTSLEMENERLRNELANVSRLNCVLENIRRSSNKGFTSMQCVDSNKNCRCGEHLNGQLRRVAQEADIELHVWQEQYEKLLVLLKRTALLNDQQPIGKFTRTSSDASNASRDSRDSMQVDDDFESEPELSAGRAGAKACQNCTGCKACCKSVMPLAINNHIAHNPKPIESDKIESEKSSFKNDGSHYMSLSSSDSDSRYDSSPIVVYDSSEDSKLMCDWPNCRQVFSNEEVLKHHRRNHIRKSTYHCQYCSARLLNKEDLELHIAKHVNREEEDEREKGSQSNDESSGVEMENNKAVNLVSNDVPRSEESGERCSSRHSKVLDRLNPQSAITNSQVSAPTNNMVRPEEYKRTRYSGVGRYRCPWPDCGYTPHFLRDLRRHMHKHTGDKKHKCDYQGCDFVSVWKTSLLQHQRKKHFAIMPSGDSPHN